MRIAFQAPLKPPDHAVPSGDRRVARLLIAALRRGGGDVEVMTRFRAYVGAAAEQCERLDAGDRLARRLAAGLAARPKRDRPHAWLTYHMYYKAPDVLGPVVARTLDIPYLVVEASASPKRAQGAWAAGEARVRAALARADAVLSLNPRDDACVRPFLDRDERIIRLRPFLDIAWPPPSRGAARAALAAELDIPDDDAPWLLCVAMMRRGDKQSSYQLLGRALENLGRRRRRLIVVGDGEARRDVEAALGPDTVFAGARLAPDLARFYAACDLFVWPAVNEAFGMALLEARAAGLPVVAGREGGVDQVVADGRSGLLAAPRDAAAFAAAVARLLDDPDRRRGMGQNGADTARQDHGIGAAARVIQRALTFATNNRRRES